MCRTWLTCLVVGLALPPQFCLPGPYARQTCDGACLHVARQSVVGQPSRGTSPPVLAAPETSAPRIGYPSSIVFVRWSLVEENGYVEMVRLNGQSGWIQASHLQPWHPMNGGNAKCVPSIMSVVGSGHPSVKAVGPSENQLGRLTGICRRLRPPSPLTWLLLSALLFLPGAAHFSAVGSRMLAGLGVFGAVAAIAVIAAIMG